MILVLRLRQVVQVCPMRNRCASVILVLQITLALRTSTHRDQSRVALSASIASMRLCGRRSVQFSSTYARHAARLSSPNTLVHPAGISANVGHSECWFSVVHEHKEAPVLVVKWVGHVGVLLLLSR